MILLSSIIKKFEGRFLARYKNILLPGHRKALQAMKRCRKEHGPHMLAQCTNHNCGKQTYIPHSCGHRSCPHCQNHESHQWIENQLDKLVPAIFSATRPWQRSSGQRPCRPLLTMISMCPKTVRNNGSLTAKRSATATRQSFILADICTGASSGNRTSSNAKMAWSPFRYLHAKTGQYMTRTVTGEYFLYLLMLHVLPKGFRRARCYGFLHPCSKKLIRFLQMALRVNPLSRFFHKLKERPAITCPVCGAKMKIIRTMIPKPSTGKAECLT